MVAAHQSGQHQGRMNNPSSEDVRAWHLTGVEGAADQCPFCG
jgi:hypothetical protein